MKARTTLLMILAIGLAGPALAGCLGGDGGGGGGSGGGQALKQVGSSTVFPIAEAWAEEVAAQHGIQVSVDGGGSGRGASAICAGEADIGDMSRALKQSEIDDCRANGIEPQVWKVAFDGITLVVNPANDWADSLTVEELEHIWRSEDPAESWADVREGWPDEPIQLFGPDSDSGTYEYFNEEILGTDCGAEGDAMCPPRSDYQPSADDNVLVEGVTGNEYALGYFGFAYFVENQDRLAAVPIVNPESSEPVTPDFDTIADGSYAPLSRPVFMVTDGKPEAETPLHTYFTYAMNEGQDVVPDVGYVALDDATLAEQRAWLE